MKFKLNYFLLSIGISSSMTLFSIYPAIIFTKSTFSSLQLFFLINIAICFSKFIGSIISIFLFHFSSIQFKLFSSFIILIISLFSYLMIINQTKFYLAHQIKINMFTSFFLGIFQNIIMNTMIPFLTIFPKSSLITFSIGNGIGSTIIFGLCYISYELKISTKMKNIYYIIPLILLIKSIIVHYIFSKDKEIQVYLDKYQINLWKSKKINEENENSKENLSSLKLLGKNDKNKNLYFSIFISIFPIPFLIFLLFLIISTIFDVGIMSSKLNIKKNIHEENNVIFSTIFLSFLYYLFDVFGKITHLFIKKTSIFKTNNYFSFFKILVFNILFYIV